MYIQNLAAKHGDKMLLIIDNVEKREGDRYLKRLNDLPCCVLVTSRYKEVSALSVYELGTLEKTECRQLFYHFYKLGRNDECLDEIIELASRHTIMVEFLAKVVQLEGMKLGNLLDRLIEKEFKLSGEDVSGNHERLQTENTIIRQMCILFSMVEVKSTKTFEAIDSTAALVVKAVHAAFTPLEKWVLQREYNLEETKKLLEEKLRGVSPEKISTPPPYIAVPALQSIAYCMDDPVLREMYAELLATAMNSETVGNVHPTYVEIIRQMSPYDALVFRELCKQVVIPCMDVVYKNKKTGQSYPISEYVVFTDLEAHPLVQTQISLENLKRLCIIDVVKNKKYAAEERYTELKSAIRNTVNEFVEMNKEILKKNEYTVEYQEYVIMIRGFGQFFARACLGTDFSDIM